MKKIMMAAAIVCAAVGVQAAAVDWQITTGATSANSGTMVYLLAADDIAASYASVTAFQDLALDSAQVKKVGGAYKTSKTTTVDPAVTTSGTYYYAILVENDTKVQYVEATGLAANVYDSAAQEASPGTYTATSFTAITGSSSYATIGAIPEPTSGLLLLLGVAGLALRRRRA